jgi:hypothetical protein
MFYLLLPLAAALSLVAVQDIYDAPDTPFDQQFYKTPVIELEGHLWRPILMEHHPDCPCLEGLRD